MASHTAPHPSNLDGDQKEEDESFVYAGQLANSLVLPMALQTAIELGVFKILAKSGPGAKLSPSQISTEMPTTNPEAPKMLDRILRMLTSHSVLSCSAGADDAGSFQRLYSLSPVSKHFVPDQDGVSFRPLMALLQDKVFLASWFNKVFNTAMLNHTTMLFKKILESYKGFEPLKQLVDVGGGLGGALHSITSKYPHIKGINFDLPHVVQQAPSYPGVEHVGGDMFKSVPKGDAIFMKGILHDWGDEQCLKLLKNCYTAIPNDGKVIVVEIFLPMMPEVSTYMKRNSQLDVLMMAQHPGGKERTRQEFEALATKAGFKGIKYKCLVYSFQVMEFFK
ncbi:hypothetical protein F2P56_014653 [Juglans regia]|uniref:Caffeic acid 3-O-methyltransferase-like n=2 Tax=Juglans regia TaxID=51240 RepID=A0A833XEC9_JUGRE|nr:caffeic acid 3-O-methyltransferase-like [Juglans regia]KAF5464584.1 hypothetical protein F2P56_014653 [Juglans regia]